MWVLGLVGSGWEHLAQAPAQGYGQHLLKSSLMTWIDWEMWSWCCGFLRIMQIQGNHCLDQQTRNHLLGHHLHQLFAKSRAFEFKTYITLFTFYSSHFMVRLFLCPLPLKEISFQSEKTSWSWRQRREWKQEKVQSFCRQPLQTLPIIIVEPAGKAH